jgi:hypothetical protein
LDVKSFVEQKEEKLAELEITKESKEKEIYNKDKSEQKELYSN